MLTGDSQSKVHVSLPFHVLPTWPLVLKLCYLAARRSGRRDQDGERVMSDEHQLLIFAK